MSLKDKIVAMRKKEEELFFAGDALFKEEVFPYFEGVKSKDEYVAAKHKFRMDNEIISDLPEGVDLGLFELRQTLRRKYPELWK
tara:strand:- start:3558 stop:3809 length:252 start_codon:yes stop_codon:yes gene_type:complete